MIRIVSARDMVSNYRRKNVDCNPYKNKIHGFPGIGTCE